MSMYQDCDRCGDEGVVYTDEDGDDIVPCPECELGEQAMDNPAALWALEVAFWANRDHECIPDLPEEGIADFADQLWEFVQYPGEVTEAAFSMLIDGWVKERFAHNRYRAAHDWNQEHPVGAPVLLKFKGHCVPTRTTSLAYVRNRMPMVKLEHRGTWWHLKRIQAVEGGAS